MALCGCCMDASLAAAGCRRGSLDQAALQHYQLSILVCAPLTHSTIYNHSELREGDGGAWQLVAAAVAIAAATAATPASGACRWSLMQNVTGSIKLETAAAGEPFTLHLGL